MVKIKSKKNNFKKKISKKRSNKMNKYNKKNKTNKIYSNKRFRKGGAPLRESFNSYTELQKYLDNNTSWIKPDTRIWIVKNGENNALYESNAKNVLESLYDYGITHQNINEYSFNIL